jgi:uncharacterized protein (TIGR03086 family)
VSSVSADLRPGPDAPPTDELSSAETTLAVLQQVLHGIGDDELTAQTPCSEFDVARLTDHLVNSVTSMGGAVAAEYVARDHNDSVEGQVIRAARPVLDAWHLRGLEGIVSLGSNEAPAKVFAGILSIEFFVHAWDYAVATGRDVVAPDSLSDYVLGLARTIITPQGRALGGFADPVDVPDTARALDRLIAFTGRSPVRSG